MGNINPTCWEAFHSLVSVNDTINEITKVPMNTGNKIKYLINSAFRVSHSLQYLHFCDCFAQFSQRYDLHLGQVTVRSVGNDFKQLIHVFLNLGSNGSGNLKV